MEFFWNSFPELIAVFVTLVISIVNYIKTGEFRNYFDTHDLPSSISNLDRRLDNIESFLSKYGYVNEGGDVNGNDNVD